jgi:hypothetical protein
MRVCITTGMMWVGKVGRNIRNIHLGGWNNSQVSEVSGMKRINTWTCHIIWDIHSYI